jgi:hypothetical protein
MKAMHRGFEQIELMSQLCRPSLPAGCGAAKRSSTLQLNHGIQTMAKHTARTMAFTLLLAAAVVPAQASGGLWCDATDSNIKLEVRSGVTRGMGGPFFDFQGGVEVMARGIAPAFHKLDLRDKLTHSWLDGDEAKLEFYHEVDGAESVDQFSLIIETEALPDTDGEYAGTYKMTSSGPPSPGSDQGHLELTGIVTCGAD